MLQPGSYAPLDEVGGRSRVGGVAEEGSVGSDQAGIPRAVVVVPMISSGGSGGGGSGGAGGIRSGGRGRGGGTGSMPV